MNTGPRRLTGERRCFVFNKSVTRNPAAKMSSGYLKKKSKHAKKLPQRRASQLQYRKDILFSLWKGITESYSKCNLICINDKLIALSGVAKLMEQALDDKYCAGLWRSHLIMDMSWRRDGGDLKPRPTP